MKKSKLIRNIQISDNDIMGNRFNGHDLHSYLIKRGIDSKQLVWTKHSDDPNTFEIAQDFLNRSQINRILGEIGQELSIHSLFYPLSYKILYNEHFLTSDVVHLHLIHNYFFSITLLPLISMLKPTVWTIHDPWAITGRCIHPYQCERWKSGCGECPNMETEFVMKDDNTALNWEIKRQNYINADIDIVVASKWMENNLKQSPLMSHFRVHRIPFGLDLTKFRPMDSKNAKIRLGIPVDKITLAFRSTSWHLKGLNTVKQLLNRLDNRDRRICLLTFNDIGLINEFKEKFDMVELGWVVDEQKMIDAYNASDVLLLPSLAEAFGMMAMEAMACGRPSIVFEGTALPDTIFAPYGGIAVPMGDDEAFLIATERLLNNYSERESIGQRARKLAEEQYDVNRYVNNIIELYVEAISRKSKIARSAYIVSQLKKLSSAEKANMRQQDKMVSDPLKLELYSLKGEFKTIKTVIDRITSSPIYRVITKLENNKEFNIIYLKVLRPILRLCWHAYMKTKLAMERL